MRKRRQHKEWAQRLTHGLAAFIIAMKGLSQLDHENLAAACILFTIAALVLLYTILHKRLHHASFAPHLETAMFAMEAIVMATVAYSYFHDGTKKFIPYAYVFSCCAYIALTIRQIIWNRQSENPAH